jgi:hypothetical protein
MDSVVDLEEAVKESTITAQTIFCLKIAHGMIKKNKTHNLYTLYILILNVMNGVENGNRISFILSIPKLLYQSILKDHILSPRACS